jgi:fructose-bisphosphate aldolase class I
LYHTPLPPSEYDSLVQTVDNLQAALGEFDSQYILGAILFENTMDRTIDSQFTADYLWEKKGIVPFLKTDKGLSEHNNGVQLMKPISDLNGLLERANEKNIFGTKMRSVIKETNPEGIRKVVEQQFDIGKQILSKELVPIIDGP